VRRKASIWAVLEWVLGERRPVDRGEFNGNFFLGTGAQERSIWRAQVNVLVPSRVGGDRQGIDKSASAHAESARQIEMGRLGHHRVRELNPVTRQSGDGGNVVTVDQVGW
jgi:hypothetical protein